MALRRSLLLVLAMTLILSFSYAEETEQNSMIADFARIQPEGVMAFIPGEDDLAVVLSAGRITGYVVRARAMGYAGYVSVTLSFNENGEVIGVQIGDSGFMETYSIGGRWLDYDRAAGLLGLSAINGGEIDAITGATITSRAVLDAVNQGMIRVASMMGKDWGDTAPVSFRNEWERGYRLVQMSGTSVAVKADENRAAQTQSGEALSVTHMSGTPAAIETVENRTAQTQSGEPPLVTVDEQGRYVTSYEGFGGQPVTIFVTLDENWAIATMEADVSTQIEGLGQNCGDPEWLSQFIGKKDKVMLGNGIDALSSATVTSTAIVRAVNQLFKNLPAK